MSASAKPTEKLFKSFLAAVLAMSLCPLMPADKAQAEEVGDSGEPIDAAQMSDEGSGRDADPTEGALAAGNSDADPELAGENHAAEDESATDDSNVALQTASDSGTPIVNWTKCGTCQWMIDAGGCLVIEPQSGESGELWDWGWTAPWINYKSSITSVAIKKTVIAKTTSGAFYDCMSLRSIDLSGLDTSQATDMSDMFSGCSSLASLDLSSLDTSQATDMSSMFRGCSSLASLDLSSFDTSKVTDMSSMFHGCSSLKSLDLSSFDTSQAADMSSMFYSCPKLASLDLSSFDTSQVTGMSGMFGCCSSLSSLDLSSFGTSKAADMSSMFYDCQSLTSLDLSSFGTSSATDMSSMFRGCGKLASLDLSSFGTSGATSMFEMFEYCQSLASLDLSSFDTSKVADMSSMFSFCSSLASLDLPPLDTSKVADMSSMFQDCSKLASLDLSPLDTSKVTDMSCMFSGCSSLASLDLSSFDTSSVVFMNSNDLAYNYYEGMFSGCSSLTTLDLSSFDTSSVKYLGAINSRNYYEGMFSGCSSLASLDLSSFDTSKVTDMSDMFYGCSSLRSVALGGEFSFSGAKGARQCSLPKLRGYGLTGFWENAETHELYTEDEIPNNVAATYAAQTKSEASKIALSESMFTVDTGSRTYTGSPIEPSVSSASLRRGADYSVAYGENVNAGEGTILITGAGNYKGQVAYSFRIDPRQVGAPEAAADLVYSGAEQVGVAPSGDYDVSGGSATNAGNYTATASLKDRRNFVWSASGNSDDIEVAWEIAKANLATSVITGVPARMEATGSQLAPEPIVTFNGKTLVQGVDYALSYGENVSPGKGTVTVSAVEGGNFTGSATVEFDIEKKAVPAPVFTDVDYSSWYGDAVSYVASRGLITGYTDGVKAGQFGVGDVLTRAQLATILWRNACPDEYASYDPETAVDTTGIDGSADGMYYTAAANWAVKNGVITGFDREDGSRDFAADENVSFEQLVTILARLCATSGELSAAGSDLSAFADGYLASDWSRGAFAWAAANGLVQGYDEPTGRYLRPGDPVARERVAVVLMRAFEMGIMK